MSIVIENALIWDSAESGVRSGADVLIEGEKIAAVGSIPADRLEGARRIDANGAMLIPGLVEAHGHLSFPLATYATAIEDTPPEESVLITMHNARIVLDAGFTGVVGAGSPKIRTEVVIRNEIDAGRIPGPRLMASTPTLTATGGLNDTGQLHQQRSVAAMVIDSPGDARRAVRLGYREGVDVVKVNISGDDFFPRPAGRVTTMAEDEVKEIGDTARALGLLVTAHARSAESIKRALRAGVTLIHHADFADEEALDMLEAAKDTIFVTPTIGYYHSLLHDSGFDEATLGRMDVRGAMEENIKTHSELRKRGVRALIGGDYGLPWQPNGTNARDIEHFVTYLGYSPAEALEAATRNGAAFMGKGAGAIQEGCLADILLVDGDPTKTPQIVADSEKLLMIMKGGVLHKAPESANR